MLKRLIEVAIIGILGISTALCLKCHVCNSVRISECRNIEEYQVEYLDECPQNNPQCVLAVRKTNGISTLTRKCVKQNFTCPAEFYCDLCNKDGCNAHNEIKNKPTDEGSKLRNPLGDVFKTTTAQICTIIFLSAIVLVWSVLLIIYRRKKNNEYEEDGYEYEEEGDCDEYYENKV